MSEETLFPVRVPNLWGKSAILIFILLFLFSLRPRLKPLAKHRGVVRAC